MESRKKGFRRLRQAAFRNPHIQQTRQRNPTDLSRSMVVLSRQGNHTKASTKVRQAVGMLLGTLIDEKA